jgi:hypothetical protein
LISIKYGTLFRGNLCLLPIVNGSRSVAFHDFSDLAPLGPLRRWGFFFGWIEVGSMDAAARYTPQFRRPISLRRRGLDIFASSDRDSGHGRSPPETRWAK